ncbi:MAG: hypothetical protein WCE90_09920 [Candidatus Zixiibacteriota bacterium]
MKIPTPEFLEALYGSYLEEYAGFIEIRQINIGQAPKQKFYPSVTEVVNDLGKFEGNIYFGVAPREVQKGDKSAVKYITCLWVDVDVGIEGHKKESRLTTFEEGLESIGKFEHVPSIIVYSGHGLQCYWLLREPEEVIDYQAVEGIIRGLIQVIGGDPGTHDVSRLMRLPNTLNVKVPEKPKEVEILKFEPTLRYNLSDFSEYQHSIVSVSSEGEEVKFSENLPKADLRKLRVSQQIKSLIKEGDKDNKYLSRSEADQAVVNSLVIAGYDSDVIKAIFCNPRYRISSKYLEKGKEGDKYLALSIRKARELKARLDKVEAFIRDGKPEQAEEEIKTLPETYRKALGDKLESLKNQSPRIFVNGNRYFKTAKGAGNAGVKFLPLSNFIIQINNRFITTETQLREVCFINVEGETSKPFILEPSQMVSAQKFKEFCISKGNFIFEGTESDLLELWKLEFAKDRGKLIFQPDHLGYLTEHNIWLFGNMAIKDEKTIASDESGIFWIGSQGFKPIPLNMVGENIEGLPAVVKLPEDETNCLLAHALANLKENIGGYQAWLALGWVKACVYSAEIFNYFKFFPFLFLYGKHQSGKNTLARWLLAFFGLSDTDGESISESTQTGISRRLSYFSSMPVWLDEYRNDKKVTRLDGFLRNVYNRIGAVKGIKKEFGTRGVTVRATLILSGEQLPEDPGLRSRCIPIQLKKKDRKDELYNWINNTSDKFSAITLKWILEKNEDNVKNLLTDVETLKNELTGKHGLDTRLAEIYAIPIGAFLSINKDQGFFDWAISEAKRDKQSKEEEQILNRFMDDIEALVRKGEIPEQYFEVDQSKGEIRLYFNGIHNIWQKDYRLRTGENPFPKQTILDHFKEEDYFIECDRRYIHGKQQRTLVLDLKKAPDNLKSLSKENEEDER